MTQTSIWCSSGCLIQFVCDFCQSEDYKGGMTTIDQQDCVCKKCFEEGTLTTNGE